MNAIDEPRLLCEISGVLEGDGVREQKAAVIAGAIRRAGGYRWASTK